MGSSFIICSWDLSLSPDLVSTKAKVLLEIQVTLMSLGLCWIEQDELSPHGQIITSCRIDIEPESLFFLSRFLPPHLFL
jgi:hypothetical protein